MGPGVLGGQGWGRTQPMGLSPDPAHGRQENRRTQETVCPFSSACALSPTEERTLEVFNFSAKSDHSKSSRTCLGPSQCSDGTK